MAKTSSKSNKQKPAARTNNKGASGVKSTMKKLSATAIPPAPPLPRPPFAVDERVTHRTFGPGVVVAVADAKLEINFKAVGVKWVLDSFVKAL
jgi:hypothetical protein